jgi:integrase
MQSTTPWFAISRGRPCALPVGTRPAAGAAAQWPARLPDHRSSKCDRDKEKLIADETWPDYPLLFTTKHGTPIEPWSFERSWQKRIANAGIPRVTVHDGRRTCGSLLADLDVNPRVAMATLLHAQFAITMEINTDVFDAATRDGLRKLRDSLT